MNEQLKRADEQLAHLVKDDPQAKRLTTLPGVGPVTATCFVSTLDSVKRFPDGQTSASLPGTCAERV